MLPHRAMVCLSCLVLGTLICSEPAQADDKPEAGKPTADSRPGPQANQAEADKAEAQYLRDIRQVTFGFPRAGEGYFSPDGKTIVFQAYPIGYPFYQIYVQDLAGGEPVRISPGRGRTTCAYFTRDGARVLFSSSHSDPQVERTEFDARQLARQGGRRRYQWDFDSHMEIYTSKIDGTDLQRLTNSEGYDAEGSYSPDGKQIVFTSMRDGDADLFLMDADGGNVRQLTNQPGYDGGPFFSPDGKWVIYRSDREREHMLQLYAISVDGMHDVQLTFNLDRVEWAPYFHPSGKFIIWGGADYSQGPRGAHFQLYTMSIDTTDETFQTGEVKQITFRDSTDILPVFSPDGTQLMWTSTRTPDGAPQLWIAEWVGEE